MWCGPSNFFLQLSFCQFYLSMVGTIITQEFKGSTLLVCLVVGMSFGIPSLINYLTSNALVRPFLSIHICWYNICYFDGPIDCYSQIYQATWDPKFIYPFVIIKIANHSMQQWVQFPSVSLHDFSSRPCCPYKCVNNIHQNTCLCTTQ